MIIVLSTGRAGSNWFSQICRDAGFDFGHENIRSDGGCGWPLLAQMKNNSNAVILHQWRDPISSCSAFSAFNPPRWRIASDRLGMDFKQHNLNTWMDYWYKYNREAYANSEFSWGLHDLHNRSTRKKIESYFGMELNWDSNKKKEHRDHLEEFTWGDLVNENQELASKILHLWWLMDRDGHNVR